jgi:hypothetical protein
MDVAPIGDKEKVRARRQDHESSCTQVAIASDYIAHAPPGEFTEVFNDVRMLVANDTLLKDGCADAFSAYNKDQFQPVDLGTGNDKVSCPAGVLLTRSLHRH